MIIGLTGTFASGKDTVADYLTSRGFTHVSTSDIIRGVLRKNGLAPTRENLQEWGNKLREKYGSGYLAKKAVGQKKGNLVVSGLRNIGEVKELRKNSRNGFLMMAIDAPIRTRFARTKQRKRTSDNLTFKEFKRREDFESSKDLNGLQTKAVIESADVLIWNNQTKEKLFRKIDKILDKRRVKS